MNSTTFRQSFLDLISKYGAFLLFVIIVVFFAIRSPSFVRFSSWMNILKHSVPISLVSLGLTFSLLVGGLDMSIGAIYSFSAIICAGFLASGAPVPIAILAALASGIGFGLVNGVATVLMRIPAFIATLSTMFIVMGLQLWYTGGERIVIENNLIFKYIGQGHISFVPFPVIILFFSIIIAYFFTKYTRTGIYIYATGGNLQASITAGIPTRLIRSIGFLISSGFCALGGIVQTSTLSGAPATSAGISFLLNGVVAVFFGAAIIGRGRPNVMGTVIGSLFIGIITDGLAFLQISHLAILGIKGIVLIAIITLNEVGRGRLKYEVGRMPI